MAPPTTSMTTSSTTSTSTLTSSTTSTSTTPISQVDASIGKHNSTFLPDEVVTVTANSYNKIAFTLN